MLRKPIRRGAFALTELVVVILILAILAGVLVPRVTDRLAAARDSRRLTDMRLVRDAIERYYLDRGEYPPPTSDAAGGGYDVSIEGDFIGELVASGHLRAPIADPINDARHFYAYNVFAQSTHGCKGKGKFYVLGIKQFETEACSAQNPGYFKCAQKDWNEDYEYVTGGGASEREPRVAARAQAK